MTDARPADPTRFILIGTSHPGNVGAAARAMKVMGFSDLVLVAPRFADVLSHPEALAMASGATDVLERARVVATFDDALGGVTLACATAMTARDFGPSTHAPREFLPAFVGRHDRLAFVFGSERFGMRNEDVYRCHACLQIPTMPGYGSLNLAQAVQLLAYDWRQALGGAVQTATPPAAALADAAAVQRVLAHCRSGLLRLGYLDPKSPKRLLPRLNRLFNRARLTVDEAQILHGIARAMEALPAPGSTSRLP